MRHSKPGEGSKAYWPKKRARRIYPHIRTYPQEAGVKPLAFAGYKAGMLHAIVVDNVKGSASFGQEISTPVTILSCPSLFVVGVRAYRMTSNGLSVFTEAWTNKLPKELANSIKRKMKIGNVKTDERLGDIEKALDSMSSIRLVVATQPELSRMGKKRPDIFEIEVGGKTVKEKFDFAKSMIGKEIKAGDVVKEGELVDAIAITIGKGMQGPVKRFGVKIQNRHAKKKRRHVGSLGQERPGKVRSTLPMAGQLGFQRRTELNKRILKIGTGDVTPTGGFKRYGTVKGDYVMLEGSVPGPKKRLVVLRSSIRPKGARVMPMEVREVAK
jgi:large subunit ribosomal protein L3